MHPLNKNKKVFSLSTPSNSWDFTGKVIDKFKSSRNENDFGRKDRSFHSTTFRDAVFLQVLL